MLCTNRQDGNTAKSWCRECEAFLCEVCEECHKAMKVSRNHAVLSFATFIKSGKGISTTAVHCADHENYPLELFDETCSKLLCYKCLKKDHSQCHVEDMHTAYESFKVSQLKKGTESLTQKLDDISKVESNVRSLSSQLDSKIEEVRKSVKDTFTDICTTLMQREEHVLLQLDPCFKAVRDNNAERLVILDQEKSRCKAVLEFSEKCCEFSDSVDMLKMRKAIESRTETCVEAELPNVKEQEACINFGQSDVQDLKEFISTFGEYYTSISDQTSDQVSGIGRIASLKSWNSTYKEKFDSQELRLNIYAEKLKNITRLVEGSRDSGTIKYKTDLQDLKLGVYMYSEVMFMKNIPWATSIQMTSDPSCPQGYLGIYLSCKNSTAGKWSCEVEVHFKILQQEVIRTNRTMKHTYTQRGGYGFPEFISLKKLMDPANGYTEGGTNEIETKVEITVKNTTGISGLTELLEEECSLDEH